ncbi:hypothetical protein HH212_22810 [Massilia forsythiae]|uniref:Uncharacterized protein n=1 Tax=Massilia forsythiae TaxID=2728020 RepID=A0A7Z2ZUK3_9BURK|nr:hypothetical protein [Massilia forsythiae]QJE02499.1 hypothetical protein HH212_22810 [Massilia forsythiae]
MKLNDYVDIYFVNKLHWPGRSGFDMKLEILGPSAWREYRGKPTSSGINETTHLAKIGDAQGRLRDCFVKLLPPQTPALLCEAIGWLLARAAAVPCPDFAAIVLVPVDALRQHGPLPSEYDKASLAPAWCSEIVAGNSVRQVHKMKFFLARSACLRSKDARKIAAFDQWSDLRDRNFGNVIHSSKGGYVAIDHETLLHDLLWLRCGMSWEERSLLENARSALAGADFQRFQLDMAAAAASHGAALVDAEADIEETLSRLFPAQGPELFSEITALLRERSAPGWMADNLKVIA